MPESLTIPEQQIVGRLRHAGVGAAEATILTVLLTRQYSRPRGDLVATLQHYAGLERAEDVAKGITELLARGFLGEFAIDGSILVGPAVDLREQVAGLLKDVFLGDELLRLRRLNDDCCTLVGPLRDGAAYSSYRRVLEFAHTQIRMLHVMTDPEALEAIDVMKARAMNGVHIRIIGASPRLAQMLRGAACGAEARRRVASWRRLSARFPQFRYRITETAEDLLFATSVMIDDSLLRLVVYDPVRERSKEGVVVEFGSIDARRLNIIRDFSARFEAAWAGARSPSFLGLVGWAMRSMGEFILGTLLVIGSLVATTSGVVTLVGESTSAVVVAVLTSIAASCFVAGALRYTRRRAWRRQLMSEES